MSRPLLAIAGPTASGKTALAVELCRRHYAEIIGCDASQVYRGLDIGTGKATPAELRGVPHHLIDVVDAGAPFDAARYAELAESAIADVTGRGRRVVICGGTGLYLRALRFGLCPAPPIEPAVRDDLRARVANGEVRALHAELAAVDPVAAARLSPADGQRIERALGVFRSTGHRLSDWQAEHGFAAPRHDIRVLWIDWPRQILAARIAARVEAMFAAGFVDEVRHLMTVPGALDVPALGYGLIAAALRGEMSLAEAKAQTVVATRRYAKRQRTWFQRVSGATRLAAPLNPSEVDAFVATVWGEK